MLSNLCSGGANDDNEDLYWVPRENNANCKSGSFKNVKVQSILMKLISHWCQ